MFVRKVLSILVLVLSLSFLVAEKSLGFSENSANIPACLNDQRQPIALDNQVVIQMKVSTPNSYRTRALVSGMVTKIYDDHSGHRHFALQIGPLPTNTLEVIYNEEFGRFPAFGVGSKVVACGDYITANKNTQYPASPDGAIIHWVHKAPSPDRHPSGYLVINGILTGQNIGDNGDNYQQKRR